MLKVSKRSILLQMKEPKFLSLETGFDLAHIEMERSFRDRSREKRSEHREDVNYVTMNMWAGLGYILQYHC